MRSRHKGTPIGETHQHVPTTNLTFALYDFRAQLDDPRHVLVPVRRIAVVQRNSERRAFRSGRRTGRARPVHLPELVGDPPAPRLRLWTRKPLVDLRGLATLAHRGLASRRPVPEVR